MMGLPYVDHLAAIADAYDRAPMRQSGIETGWHELAADSVARAAGIRTWLAVEETDASEPYPDAAAMFADIARGHFMVSRAHCEHPVWTPAQNVAFRIVHDVCGHYASGGDFGWLGENRACDLHFPLLATQAAREALFTECIAQTAYAIHNHGFGPQKLALIRHA
jgi:hypothetical protein